MNNKSQKECREMKNILKSNKGDKKKHQNLWGVAKALSRGKFIVVTTIMETLQSCHINDLTIRLNGLEK